MEMELRKLIISVVKGVFGRGKRKYPGDSLQAALLVSIPLCLISVANRWKFRLQAFRFVYSVQRGSSLSHVSLLRPHLYSQACD